MNSRIPFNLKTLDVVKSLKKITMPFYLYNNRVYVWNNQHYEMKAIVTVGACNRLRLPCPEWPLGGSVRPIVNTADSQLEAGEDAV